MTGQELTFSFPIFHPLVEDPVQLNELKATVKAELDDYQPGYTPKVSQQIREIMEQRYGLWTIPYVDDLKPDGYFHSDGNWHTDPESSGAMTEGMLSLLTTSTPTTFAACEVLIKPSVEELLHHPISEHDFTNEVFNDTACRRTFIALKNKFGLDWLDAASDKSETRHVHLDINKYVEVRNLETCQAKPFDVAFGQTSETLHRASKWQEGEPRRRILVKGGARIIGLAA
jgi:hypothetical protein